MPTNRPGDCVIAILDQPDVAMQLTCTAPGKWRSMIFEFATKKVVYADEKAARLSDAQKDLLSRLATLYGAAPPEVKWRESFPTRGDGPSG